ncbi:MAG TPA: choloylglycine hydrolase family protein [Candidatus Scybalocola faecavium]|nr:choloylglycine hydrolase family protein [Candidatus Scybalocola faecavium]
MCTCIAYENGDFYFGRNLDLDCSFGEKVVVTPRNFSLTFKKAGELNTHFAMIGMASAVPSFPLYAEAVNEKGLCMAGLNFPGNACYLPVAEEGVEIASFEIIPWILSQCESVAQAETYLKDMRIVDLAFSEQMSPAPLHWMLADKEQCLVLEAVKDGLKVYENPFGVLTNNPPFDYHRMNMNNYLNLSAQSPENRFSQKLNLRPYAQGMGAMGLPGDASSASRFIRAAFLKWNSVAPKDEDSNVSQFFHILDGVAMVRGSVITEAGTYDVTTYSCCVNVGTGDYYYKTYDDSRIRKVGLYETDLEGTALMIL